MRTAMTLIWLSSICGLATIATDSGWMLLASVVLFANGTAVMLVEAWGESMKA